VKKIFKWAFIACILFISFFIAYRFFYNSAINSFGSGSKYVNILSEKERDWLNNQSVLVYSADRNAPPLRFVDKADNQYKGVVVDYINSLSLEIGTKIETYPRLWEDALESLSKGETDICDMFASEERAKKYLFTKPIYNLRAVLAVKSHDNGIRGLYDLNGKTIATQKGDYTNEYIRINYPGITMRYVDDIYEAMKLLQKGQVDAVAGDEPVVLYQIDKSNLSSEIKIIDKPLYENEVVFAIPKSKPELITILNKGIDSLNRKGQLEKIQQKWFGISTPIVTHYDLSKLKNYVAASAALMIFALLVMITWNQSLKKQVEARTKELENNRNDLQILFDGITEYMVVVDRQNNIINVNDGFLDFANEIKENILNKPCGSFLRKFCISCEDCLIKQTFYMGKNYKKEVFCVNEVYEMRTYPLKDPKGFVNNVLVLIHNTTSEKINKNQMLQSNKMIAIGELAAGVAHEIRNPLGIIRNHSFILKNTMDRNEKLDKSLEFIDSAVIRASRTIDNLLNFSRLSGNSQEWVDIKSFINSMLELQIKNAHKLGISFQLVCRDDLSFYTNQESLKHILINLFSNSIDSIDDGGNITLEIEELEKGIAIKCFDTGCGIEKRDMERIFNPFYTTKEPGKGTGLGLYIVYNEVKKLNGNITIQSELNIGSCFSVFIPANKEVVIS